MLWYFDYLLNIGSKPKEFMGTLKTIFRWKEGFGSPDRYLGAKVEKVQLEDGQVICYTNCV